MAFSAIAKGRPTVQRQRPGKGIVDKADIHWSFVAVIWLSVGSKVLLMFSKHGINLLYYIMLG